MTPEQWEQGKFTVDDPVYGEIRFNALLPIEWQLDEIRCDYCDMEDDCRKCSAFEYSLLYQLMGGHSA